MLNSGYGFQAWNARKGPAPTADQVGQQLAQQQQGSMLPSLGGMDPAAMMGGGPRGGPRGPSAEQQMAADGDASYDPTQEHSAANTRAALEDAVRRSQDIGSRPALKRPAAPNQAWQLATLGLDPVSIALFTQTGDAAGGAE